MPFHKIRNASPADPSIWFSLVTDVVAKVPPVCLRVSAVYATEPVSESLIGALRMPHPSTGLKERFISSEATGSWGDERWGP